MKKKAILVRLSQREYDGIKTISEKEKWSLNQVGEEAIKFYLKARRILKNNK